MSDLRESIQASLASIDTSPLRESAIGLLATLGYSSERTVNLGHSSPTEFLNFIRSHSTGGQFSESKALFTLGNLLTCSSNSPMRN